MIRKIALFYSILFQNNCLGLTMIFAVKYGLKYFFEYCSCLVLNTSSNLAFTRRNVFHRYYFLAKLSARIGYNQSTIYRVYKKKR
jgi:hypothetical protein